MKMHIQSGILDGCRVFSEKVIRSAHKAWASCNEKRGEFAAKGYGYGWLIGDFRGSDAVWHSGGFPGYLSLMSFLPLEKIGVSVLINDGVAGFPLMYLIATFCYEWWSSEGDLLTAYRSRVDELAKQVHQRQKRIADHTAERAKREWKLPHPFTHYTGTYQSQAYGTIQIKGHRDGMEVRMGNMHCMATPYTAKHTARVEMVPGRGEVITFEMDGDKVLGLTNDGEMFMKIR